MAQDHVQSNNQQNLAGLAVDGRSLDFGLSSPGVGDFQNYVAEKTKTNTKPAVVEFYRSFVKKFFAVLLWFPKKQRKFNFSLDELHNYSRHLKIAHQLTT